MVVAICFFKVLSGTHAVTRLLTAVNSFRPVTIVADFIAFVGYSLTIDGESMNRLLRSSRNVLQDTTKTRPFFPR